MIKNQCWIAGLDSSRRLNGVRPVVKPSTTEKWPPATRQRCNCFVLFTLKNLVKTQRTQPRPPGFYSNLTNNLEGQQKRKIEQKNLPNSLKKWRLFGVDCDADGRRSCLTRASERRSPTREKRRTGRSGVAVALNTEGESKEQPPVNG